eukprot:8578507-Heterocapsa_arctica.AAC.1
MIVSLTPHEQELLPVADLQALSPAAALLAGVKFILAATTEDDVKAKQTSIIDDLAVLAQIIVAAKASKTDL